MAVGNPQWAEWVENWAFQAGETGSKAEQSYKKAASSLRKNPVTFVHPEEAITLEGIGPKIVERLVSALKAHCESTGEEMPERIVPAKKPRAAKASGAAPKKKRGAPSQSDEDEADRLRDERRQRTKTGTGFVPNKAPSQSRTPLDLSDDDAPAAAGLAKAKNSKAYVPALRSGAYAILVALYILSSYDEQDRWCIREEITSVGAEHSKTPFDAPTAMRAGNAEAGRANYSAWSGKQTLIDKELVVAQNKRPPRWALTDTGYTLAESLATKAGVARHVRGPSSSSAGGAFGVGSSNAGRRPATPVAEGDDDDDEEADFRAQLKRAMDESLNSTQALTSGSGSYGAPPLVERRPLPKPKPRDSNPSSSSSRPTHDVDGRKAAKGLYAGNVDEAVQAPAKLGVDSPFGYHYLDEDDHRVKSREDAEVGQDDNLQPTYRIEYRTAQDLHKMAQGISGKSPLVRSTRLPGPATMSGYLRARVANAVCPGFPEAATKAAATAADDSMASLMGGYKAPAKVDKAAYMAPPAEVRRWGNDAYALIRNSLPLAAASTSASASAAKGVAKPPGVARTQSAPIRANAGTSAATTSHALPGLSAAALRPSSSQPIAASFARPSNQPHINRHPLEPVRDYVPTETHHFPRFNSIVWPAGSFKIVLIIDTREIGTNAKNRLEMVEKVAKSNVLVDRKMLPLGDMIWVGRRYRDGAPTGEDDVVLDAIVERKRLDDLCGSIKDGRYAAQKIRIKDSAISHRIYLIEKYDAATQYAQFGAQIWTAKSQLQVNDGFYVHESSNIADTVNYLSQRTKVMMEMYETDLHIIPDTHIDRPAYLAFQQHLRSTRPATKFLTTYSAFANLNKTDAALTLRKQWASMIQRVSGVSAEKAVQVLQRWPTPLSFFKEAEVHRLEVEEENEAFDESQTGKGKGKAKKRKAEDFVTEVLGGDVAQRGVKGKVATRLFHLFAAEEYDE